MVHLWLLGHFPNPDNRGFDQAFVDETGVPDLTAPVRFRPRTLRWREYRVIDPQGIVVLNNLFSDNDWLACYAYTEFTVDREMEVELRIGSDDSVKVWLNGQLVHQFGGMRGLTVDQDRVRVRLQKGGEPAALESHSRRRCLGILCPLGRPAGATCAAVSLRRRR